MSVADNSYFAFNQNDFIDLDTALVEEETTSLGNNSQNNDIDGMFRLSFKNYDDTAIQKLRNSLITPMSTSSSPIDPMYKAMENNTWRLPPLYSPRIGNESPIRPRIALSPTPSAADSLAHFNKIVSDNNSVVDLVKSDLKELMGSYDNETMSIRDFATPSPQINQESFVSRNTASSSNGNTNRQQIITSSPMEEHPRYRGTLLFELASKQTAPSKQKENPTTIINNTEHTSSSGTKQNTDASSSHCLTKQPTNYVSHIPRRVSQSKSTSKYSQEWLPPNVIKMTSTNNTSRYQKQPRDSLFSGKDNLVSTQGIHVAPRMSQQHPSTENTTKITTSRYSPNHLLYAHDHHRDKKEEQKKFEPRHSATTTATTTMKEATKTTSQARDNTSRRLCTKDKPNKEHKRHESGHANDASKPVPSAQKISAITSQYTQRPSGSLMEHTNPRKVTRTASGRMDSTAPRQHSTKSSRTSLVLDNTTHDVNSSSRMRRTTSLNQRTAKMETEKDPPPPDTKHHRISGSILKQKVSTQDKGSAHLSRRVSFLDEQKPPRRVSFADDNREPPMDKRSSYNGKAPVRANQPRRSRSFSAIPSDVHQHSSLPVPSRRTRNSNQAKNETTAVTVGFEDQKANENYACSVYQHTSHSSMTDGGSSSSSSYSEDYDNGPATPPSRHSYLSENGPYRHPTTTTKKSATKTALQSVSDVLEQVKQRRARTAAILKGIYN
ncbi:uncharacterized protein EV154DRAFT_603752 [Mucor mucedo]|uniref:uncharacterized protein n=1 Tax=Mucor mucedo TaxID=29922 RepID=UPI00221EAA1B|nr:uncharacterized protein EV154DRAFT_603752 [Mucor mucedo]KAI7889786.1 hypothetical protein EV154DRAFT_603752 [Mucor mucedo]